MIAAIHLDSMRWRIVKAFQHEQSATDEEAAVLVGWSSMCTLSAMEFRRYQDRRGCVLISRGMRSLLWMTTKRKTS